jgi:hypothetical protein
MFGLTPPSKNICINRLFFREMKKIKIRWLGPLLLLALSALGQSREPDNENKPLKIMHAEPLYIDLIRDLGARKGEKEWNVGLGMTDKLSYDSYQMLVEYEFAPVHRLGVEFEVPVTLYSRTVNAENAPSNRVESVKSAVQYTFLVHEKARLSAAIGYLNELELTDLNKIRGSSLVRGNRFNPFLIVAKRLGSDFHTLLYTGPDFTYHFRDRSWHCSFAVNSNLHYTIPGTRNFVGVEVNKVFGRDDFSMVIRPQMRLSIVDHLLIGIVPGIPVSKRQERLSAFVRLIYEPKLRQP